jgi:hypothetical protein
MEILRILNQIASLNLAPILGEDRVLLPEPLGDFLFFTGVMGLVIIQNLHSRQDEWQFYEGDEINVDCPDC